MPLTIISKEGQRLSKKADIALADLTSDGGLLNPDQNSTFIRNLIDQPTILNDVRSVSMDTPEMQLNKIGIGSRMMKPAVQTAGSRALSSSDRTKPDLSQVSLTTKEMIAEIDLPYEVLEDNIEREDMENTILALMGGRAATDFEELLILGDTGSGDSYLAQMDGILQLSTSNVLDVGGEAITPSVFNEAKKTLPTKYRRNLNTMRFYVSMDTESDYRLAVSNRNTVLGDSILTGTQLLPVFGIPMSGAALMPDSNLVLTNPQNIIFGIQRNIRIETDRIIRERVIVIVLTVRIGIQIEEVTAIVKGTNIGAAV